MNRTLERMLRQAVRCSGVSINSLAKQAGVSQPVLHGFVHGAGINIRTADKLIEHFGFAILPRGEAPRSSR